MPLVEPSPSIGGKIFHKTVNENAFFRCVKSVVAFWGAKYRVLHNQSDFVFAEASTEAACAMDLAEVTNEYLRAFDPEHCGTPDWQLVVLHFSTLHERAARGLQKSAAAGAAAAAIPAVHVATPPLDDSVASAGARDAAAGVGRSAVELGALRLTDTLQLNAAGASADDESVSANEEVESVPSEAADELASQAVELHWKPLYCLVPSMNGRFARIAAEDNLWIGRLKATLEWQVLDEGACVTAKARLRSPNNRRRERSQSTDDAHTDVANKDALSTELATHLTHMLGSPRHPFGFMATYAACDLDELVQTHAAGDEADRESALVAAAQLQADLSSQLCASLRETFDFFTTRLPASLAGLVDVLVHEAVEARLYDSISRLYRAVYATKQAVLNARVQVLAALSPRAFGVSYKLASALVQSPALAEALPLLPRQRAVADKVDLFINGMRERTRQMDNVLGRLWQTTEHVALVLGARGSGKTALVQQLAGEHGNGGIADCIVELATPADRLADEAVHAGGAPAKRVSLLALVDTPPGEALLRQPLPALVAQASSFVIVFSVHDAPSLACAEALAAAVAAAAGRPTSELNAVLVATMVDRGPPQRARAISHAAGVAAAGRLGLGYVELGNGGPAGSGRAAAEQVLRGLIDADLRRQGADVFLSGDDVLPMACYEIVRAGPALAADIFAELRFMEDYMLQADAQSEGGYNVAVMSAACEVLMTTDTAEFVRDEQAGEQRAYGPRAVRDKADEMRRALLAHAL